MFVAVAVSFLVSFNTGQAIASSTGTPPPSQQWSTDGFFGAFDRAQLKRGYQVFQEICSSCH
ncbi:MAG: cytochrome c1, partial [Rhodospirillaceae bacterium]|nr:cytochrome c1 [Rhodospirillaceae bacterium]